MDVLDGLGAHRCGLRDGLPVLFQNLPILVVDRNPPPTGEKGVVKCLDGGGVQGLQADGPQGGLDVHPDIAGIDFPCPGLDPAQVGGGPGVQPLPHGLLVGGGVGAVINGGGSVSQLLRYLLLGFAGDGALNLLSGAWVSPCGIAGLPVFIGLASAGDGFLADRASPRCGASGHR